MSAVFIPVRKGGLVILHQQRLYNSLLMGAYAGSERYVPAIVTEATREGTAKKARTSTSNATAIDTRDRVLVLSDATLKGADPLAVFARLDHWYDTLADARRALMDAIAFVTRPTTCPDCREPMPDDGPRCESDTCRSIRMCEAAGVFGADE